MLSATPVTILFSYNTYHGISYYSYHGVSYYSRYVIGNINQLTMTIQSATIYSSQFSLPMALRKALNAVNMDKVGEL